MTCKLEKFAYYLKLAAIQESCQNSKLHFFLQF